MSIDLLKLLWLSLLLVGPVTIILQDSLLLTSPIATANLVQRITGLMVYSILFMQIVIGARMQYFTDKFGGKIYTVHRIQGVLAYSILILHALSELYIHTSIGRSLMGFFIPNFTTSHDLFLTFGRIALILITLTIFTALFRQKPYFRWIWKRIHLFNYAAFYLYSYHAIRLGTDARLFPFVIVFIAANLSVTYLVIKRLSFFLKEKLERISTTNSV